MLFTYPDPFRNWFEFGWTKDGVFETREGSFWIDDVAALEWVTVPTVVATWRARVHAQWSVVKSGCPARVGRTGTGPRISYGSSHLSSKVGQWLRMETISYAQTQQLMMINLRKGLLQDLQETFLPSRQCYTFPFISPPDNLFETFLYLFFFAT